MSEGASRATLVGAFVAIVLGACTKDSQRLGLSGGVDSAALTSDSGRDSGGGQDAAEWCVDTRSRIGGCFVALPEAPSGKEIDSTSLELRVLGYSGDTVLDERFERVSDQPGCGTAKGAAWYYRQSPEPPLLMLCPSACVFEQGGQALLWVRANCL